ncbi:MAG: hypothetical protein GY697_00980 [Desulfobacterales bacterium]|nr:hypothetical protein [Desulfobacterales bacterium]
MSSVKVDKKLNRLTITLAAANREELSKVVADIKAAASELEPDLTCLTDFRKIWTLLPVNIDLLGKAQQYLLKTGIGKAVRVLNPDQFNTPTYKLLDALTTDYRYSYATSPQEGKQILNNFRQELLRGARYSRNGKTLFKYVDRSGWEQDTTAVDFDKVMKKLRKFRGKGRQHVIVVDAGFKQRT